MLCVHLPPQLSYHTGNCNPTCTTHGKGGKKQHTLQIQTRQENFILNMELGLSQNILEILDPQRKSFRKENRVIQMF